MANYNFHDLLDPIEFQHLVRDVVQVREGLFFENFAEGPDKGADGLFRDQSGLVVLQCKRYQEFSKLYSQMKKELAKVKRLNPRRYLLGASLNFTSPQKEKLIALFGGCLASGDIIGQEDLNGYLDAPAYRHIQKSYVRLWLHGPQMLPDLLERAVNRQQHQESAFELRQALKTAELFVETKPYRTALDRLQRHHTVLLSGEPGVGKTTMAYLLALSYLGEERQGFFWVNSINDVYRLLTDGEEKQVFLWDDFWGSIFFEENSLNEERRLEKLIERFRGMPSKRLILTSREYILQQGLHRCPTLVRLFEGLNLSCILRDYSFAERTWIFFRHLKASGLPYEWVAALCGKAEEIIAHPCYHPRVIGEYLSRGNEDGLSPREYAEQLAFYLEYPEEFWDAIFRNLSEGARVTALLLFLSAPPAPVEELQTAYAGYLRTCCDGVRTKNFGDCITELEKTLLHTFLDEERLMADFQNPSIQDFLLELLRRNAESYVPPLVRSASYFRHLLVLLELSDDFLQAPLRCLLEEACIKGFDTLPLKSRQAIEYEWEPDSRLDRLAQLARLCKPDRHPLLARFIERTAREYCGSMQRQEFEGDFLELSAFPGLIARCAALGLSFDAGEILEAYHEKLTNLLHYRELEALRKPFSAQYDAFLSSHQAEIRGRFEALALASIRFFEEHEDDLWWQLDELCDEIPALFYQYGVELRQEFWDQVLDLSGHAPARHLLPSPPAGDLISPERPLVRDQDSMAAADRAVLSEAVRWVLGEEEAALSQEEAFRRIEDSTLSQKQKDRLISRIATGEPWFLGEAAREAVLLEIILSLMEEGTVSDRFLDDISFVMMAVTLRIAPDDDAACRLAGFCANYIAGLLSDECPFLSADDFKRCDAYRESLKGDMGLEASIFRFVLQRSEGWVMPRGKLLLLYWFYNFMCDMPELDDLYGAILQPDGDRAFVYTAGDPYPDLLCCDYFEYTFRNSEMQRLSYLLLEELDPEEFHRRFLFSVWKDFLSGRESKSGLALLRRMQPQILLSEDGTIDSISVLFNSTFNLAALLGLGDFAFLCGKRLSEPQMAALPKGKGPWISLQNEGDLSVLVQLGAAKQIDSIVARIRTSVEWFEDGDFSEICREEACPSPAQE